MGGLETTLELNLNLLFPGRLTGVTIFQGSITLARPAGGGNWIYWTNITNITKILWQQYQVQPVKYFQTME